MLYGLYNNGISNINKGEIETYLSTSHPKGKSYGIYNESIGTLTIGLENESLNSDNINVLATALVSNSYGVYNNNGTFNFLSGKISGTLSSNGLITKIPDGSMIVTKTENNIESASLDICTAAAQIENTTYMTLQEALESVNDNEFTTIKLLRNIVLKEAEFVTITENKNIYLDMNGCTLMSGNGSVISNYGQLEIGDKQTCPNILLSEMVKNSEYYFEDDGTGAFVSNNNGISGSTANSYIKIDLSTFEQSFSLTVNAELYSYRNPQNPPTESIGYMTITDTIDAPMYNSSEGQFFKLSGNRAGNYNIELKGKKVYYLHFGYYKPSYGGSHKYDYLKINRIYLNPLGRILNSNGRCISNYGNLTISKGVTLNTLDKISTETIISTIYNVGEFNMNGGIILNSQTYNIYNDTLGKITITNGFISSLDGTAIYNNSTNDVIINNAYIFATQTDQDISHFLSTISLTGIQNTYYGRNISINNTNLTIIHTGQGTAYGIQNSQGIININSCKIKVFQTYYNDYYNSTRAISNNGTTTIDNTDIITKGSKNSCTISNSKILNINNCNIQSLYSSLNYNLYGISNSSNGIVTLGINDGIVNINQPFISVSGTSSSVAISNSGTLNIYDGKIVGPITISGKITETAPGYEIKKTTVDGISTDILALSSTDNTVCVMNSVNYTKLEDAIAACTGTDEYTISLTNGCELTSPITIPSGKNITLSINGFDINYSGTDSMIINNGTLTIKDTNTVNSGEILNNLGNVIENNGTLIIGENDNNVTTRSPHIVGKETGIINNGTIQFYDGTITGITPISGTTIGTIPDDYTLVETTDGENKVLSLVGIAPSITYATETVSEGTKIIVTATDTNLSKIVNPDNTEATGNATQIVSEYIATKSGIYTFRAIDQNNNVTTIDVAI